MIKRDTNAAVGPPARPALTDLELSNVSPKSLELKYPRNSPTTQAAHVQAGHARSWAAFVRLPPGRTCTAQSEREAQRQVLADWAAAHGAILHWYEEVGWPRKGRGRQFTRMLTDLDRLGLAGIVVSALDNLARDGLSLIQLTSDLGTNGKQLIALLQDDEKIVSSISVAAQDARAALTAVVEFDRRVRTRLMRSGWERKRLSGWKPGREPKTVNWKDAKRLLDAGASVAVTARAFGLSRVQFWRRMKEQGLASQRTRPFGKPKP